MSDLAAPAVADMARLGGNLAVASALVTDGRPDHLAERGPADGAELAGTLAFGAGLDRRARLGAVAVAVLTPLNGLEGNLHLGALGGLEQGEVGPHGHVGAGGGPSGTSPAKRPPAAEERLEDVSYRAKALEVGRVAAAAQALLPVAVIGGASLGIGQHLIRLRGLLELVLGLGVVAVDVGVKFAGELAKRLLDLGFAGVAADAENFVIVAGGAHRRLQWVIGCRRRRRRRTRAGRRPRVRCGSRDRSPCAAGRSPRPPRDCAVEVRSWRRREPANAAPEPRSRSRS